MIGISICDNNIEYIEYIPECTLFFYAYNNPFLKYINYELNINTIEKYNIEMEEKNILNCIGLK